MAISLEALNALIARIYDCGADRKQWEALLADLARLLRADQARLFSPLARPPHEPIWVEYGISPDQRAGHDDQRHVLDALATLPQSPFVAGRCVTMTPEQRLKLGESCNDAGHPDGVLHACLGVIFDHNSAPMPPAILGLYREPQHPNFTHKEERLVEVLIPHLQRAARMALRIDSARFIG